MYCEDTDVCLERVLVHSGAKHMARWKIGPAHPNQSRSHCLALDTRTRRDATDVCLSRALLKWRVYMGNGWHGRAVMPLMCVLCTRL